MKTGRKKKLKIEKKKISRKQFGLNGRSETQHAQKYEQRRLALMSEREYCPLSKITELNN